MPIISLGSPDLDARVEALGILLGLLDEASPGTLNLDLDWFASPLDRLEAIPTNAAGLLGVIRALLHEVKPVASADARAWYPLAAHANDPGVNGVYLVLPPASDTAVPATIGVGVMLATGEGACTFTGSAYFPLFHLPVAAPFLITGTGGDPIEIRFGAGKTDGTFHAAHGPTFTGFDLLCNVFVDGTPPDFALSFRELTPAEPHLNPVTSLASLVDPSVTAWLNALLATNEVTAWLGTTIPASATTIGAVLQKMQLVTVNAGVYGSGNFDAFAGKSPTAVAELLLADALGVLATNTHPLMASRRRCARARFASVAPTRLSIHCRRPRISSTAP